MKVEVKPMSGKKNRRKKTFTENQNENGKPLNLKGVTI